MTLESAARLPNPEEANSKNANARLDPSDFWLSGQMPYITTGINDRHIPIFQGAEQAAALWSTDAAGRPEAQLNLKPSPLEHKLIFHESTAEACHHAFASHKPLVVVFSQNGEYSQKMQQALDSMQLGGAAGEAVFLRADLDRDLVALGMAKKLGVTKFPTISVLDTADPDQLQETARIEGHVPGQTLKSTLISYIEAVNKAQGES